MLQRIGVPDVANVTGRCERKVKAPKPKQVESRAGCMRVVSQQALSLLQLFEAIESRS